MPLSPESRAALEHLARYLREVIENIEDLIKQPDELARLEERVGVAHAVAAKMMQITGVAMQREDARSPEEAAAEAIRKAQRRS